MKPKVFFLAPLPPPVHGFSVISSNVFALLTATGAEIHLINSQPSGFWQGLLKLIGFIRATAFTPATYKQCLYIALSGGVRQYLDMLYVLVARAFRIRMYVHHHSYYYLNQRPIQSRLIFSLLKNATHIALCDAMREKISKNYGISVQNIQTISNSAFIPAQNQNNLYHPETGQSIKIGYLANITQDKGIFVFLDAIERLSEAGHNVEALIGGPLDPTIKPAFEAAISKLPNVKYIGAVYDEKKHSFFRLINIFAFPTLYKNEAEPLVIWEAQSYGIPAASINRGCIPCLLGQNGDLLAESAADFLSKLELAICKVLAHPDYYLFLSNNAMRHFADIKLSSNRTLDKLINDLTS